MHGTVLDRLERVGRSPLGIIGTWAGRFAPDFEITALDGRRVSLENVRGKIVLLNFWTTWCEACIREMPALDRFYQDFRDEAFALLAVNLRESPARVEAFRNTHRIRCPILLDREGEVGDAYGVLAIPATFILDREGMMIGKITGARDWASVTARCLIHELLLSD
ncbi:MAG: TlpA family protein disulfide reductase [Nitrospirae bacterium]|nr:TlpA family protein disulfide reductase [Nitrospirota bacterium]